MFSSTKKDIQDNYLIVDKAITIYEESDGKTQKAKRLVPLSGKAKEALNRLETNQSWLFPSQGGTPSMSAVERAFKRIVRQTAIWRKVERRYKGKFIEPAIKITMYSFRHTFATRCIQRGMPAHLLKEIMGHEDIQTTLKYYVDLSMEDILKAKTYMDS